MREADRDQAGGRGATASRDAAATRRRILDAAVTEFADLGFAGARVDRIAEAAASNKRMIYVYFGDKEGLFTAALDLVLGEVMAAVPITEDDLPGYAGALFDYMRARPDAMRMSMWRQLERPSSGPAAKALYVEKVDAIRRAGGKDGLVGGLPAVDVLVLVQSLAGAWFLSPVDLLTAEGDDPAAPDRLATHRGVLVEATRRLTSATPSPIR